MAKSVLERGSEGTDYKELQERGGQGGRMAQLKHNKSQAATGLRLGTAALTGVKGERGERTEQPGTIRY